MNHALYKQRESKQIVKLNTVLPYILLMIFYCSFQRNKEINAISILEGYYTYVCLVTVSIYVPIGSIALNDSDWDSGISLQDSEHSQRYSRNSWRATGYAAFCSSPALKHLIIVLE
jgi:hypothetical protein